AVPPRLTLRSAVDIATKLTIPSIAAVDSSMDEAAIRDALTGNFDKHAADIAKLTATSITIPEISFTITATTSGTPVTTTVSYKDIVLSGVKDGVAAEASVGSATSTTDAGSFEFGALSAKAFDIGGLMSFYSVVPASADPGFKPIYKDFVFAGGKFTSPTVSCALGQITAAEFDTRPLKVPFSQFMALSQGLKDTKPTPEQMKTLVDFFVDVFTAFKSEPITMDGLSCSGSGEDKQPFAFSVGKLKMDGYAPGIYPGITATDIKLTGGGDGAISISEATFKQTDLSQPLKALQDAGATLTPDWFETNYRLIVPAFAGFSFKGLSIDVPPGDTDGSRVKVDIADFDLTLANYVNGIPTSISSVSHGIDVPLPADSEDESVKTLLALGISHVNLNYEFGLNWDQASQTINVSKIAVSGNDLGSVAVAALIGNATPQLFALDTNAQLAAGQNVTLKSFGLDLADAGIADRFMPLLAAQEGVSDPAEYRVKMGGALEGAVLGILGSTDEARAVGAAIGDFVSGKAKALSIKVDAVSPAGLPLPLVMQAQSDPSVLRGEVTVSGSAH
ncbi:MAG: hypothetical protein ABI697_02965, partial [Devosia sp.]